jgi:UDP-N-acetylglucosamine:LPS N-acetylglucosamine transferase
MNLVFDQKAIQTWQEIYPEAKYDDLGWFVRDEYQPLENKAALRKSLKLQPDTFTLLMVSGSEGTNSILKILPGLITSSKPVQIIVACGANKMLLRSVKLLRKILRKTHKKHTILPLGFTKNLHQYMQASDLVVGKAGPNTLFESVATHTPFFAITHITGQEDGNLEIIRDYQIGYVEEKPSKATKLLKRIIKNPSMLEKFQPFLKTLAKKNSQAPQKFLRLTTSLL